MAANKRHRLFAKQTSESGGWRPKKLYRVSAKRNVECWDDWIGTSTHNDGLVVLQPDWEKPEWSDANWRNWMSATTILDQGSDNVCAVHVCTYKLGLNMWGMWDHWHGVDNDVLCAYKASDLYALVILFMVVLNLPHGNDREPDGRFWQLAEAREYLFDKFSAETSASFARRCDYMLEEHSEELDVVDGETPMVALWSLLREQSPYTNKGHKVKLCEFLKWVTSSREFLKKWHTKTFEIEFLAVEADFSIAGAALAKAVVTPSVTAEASSVTSTADVTNVEAKALWKSAQNAVVVALLTLMTAGIKRTIAAMVCFAESYARWFGKGNQACRSFEKSSEWLVQQLATGLMDAMLGSIAALHNKEYLIMIGFLEFEQVLDAQEL
jgi:hypothetical protein